jgi:hypothetical protein
MWKRRFVLAGLFVALGGALLVGWQYYAKLGSNKELQDAIAEADRLDPGWRLEELEAKREVIPDSENSAVQVLDIKESINGWPPRSMISSSDLEVTLRDLSPDIQLNAKQTNHLRAELEKVNEALGKARQLTQYRRGWYRVNWSPDYKSPSRATRDVMTLLQDDARLRAQDKDIEGAFISALNILSVSKSIGDEPYLMSQLVRMANQRGAVETLERTLGQGEVSASSLANAQRQFEDEAAQRLFLFGVRGERAGYHHMMELIESGQMKASMFFQATTVPTAKIEAWFEDRNAEALLRKSHAPHVRVMTKIVEIAKLPVEEQPSKLKAYLHSIDNDSDLPIQVRLLRPSMEKFGESFWRFQALIRCAIVGIATERYRLTHKQWPDSLKSLVPDFLAKVPLDPFDAKPLRYRRLENGVLIYSIGPDEKDDGGKVDRQNPRESPDIGFQLWDVNRRRQPWRPPVKKPIDKDE